MKAALNPTPAQQALPSGAASAEPVASSPATDNEIEELRKKIDNL
jgi:hypothetical protein